MSVASALGNTAEMISVKLKRVRKAVQKAKCEKAVRRSVQELLKASVDDAKGPPVDTPRVRSHALPEGRPQEAETIETPMSEEVDAEGLVERTVRSGKKTQMHVDRPVISIMNPGDHVLEN